MKKVIILLALVSTAIFAQQKGSFTDPRDKKTYKTVKIGKQTWMAENLNYKTEYSMCYKKDDDYCAKFGRLYYWWDAMSVTQECTKKTYDRGIPFCINEYKKYQGICPNGWYIPSNEDWNELEDYIEKVKECENCVGKYLKSKNGWEKGGNGLDSYGFNAKLVGHRTEYGRFEGIGNNGYWWSSTHARGVNLNNGILYLGSIAEFVLSIRCVKYGPNEAAKEAAAAAVDAVIAAEAEAAKAAEEAQLNR
jgi:uncharacterized protein (TIGR02145 family)